MTTSTIDLRAQIRPTAAERLVLAVVGAIERRILARAADRAERRDAAALSACVIASRRREARERMQNDVYRAHMPRL